MKNFARNRIQRTAVYVGRFMLAAVSTSLLSVAAAYSEPSEELAMADGKLSFVGDIVGETDISGVSVRGDFIIIGCMEIAGSVYPMADGGGKVNGFNIFNGVVSCIDEAFGNRKRK